MLNRYRVAKLYRGFESLRLRHFQGARVKPRLEGTDREDAQGARLGMVELTASKGWFLLDRSQVKLLTGKGDQAFTTKQSSTLRPLCDFVD